MTTAPALDDTIRQILGDIAPEADLTTLDPHAQLQEALDLDSADFLTYVTRSTRPPASTSRNGTIHWSPPSLAASTTSPALQRNQPLKGGEPS